jgi:Family of unknown function (DUF5681)
LTMPEGDGVIGYKSPPRSTRYPTGVSGNPKGRPKRKEGLPYAKILDRMVTIKDGRGARQVTAEEAFLLYLRKKAVDGDEAAQERLEEIQAFRREHDPDLGSEGITTIVRVIVSPDNPNYALRLLKMAVRLYPFQPHAQIRLEPWLVQRALDRLGDRRLNRIARLKIGILDIRSLARGRSRDRRVIRLACGNRRTGRRETARSSLAPRLLRLLRRDAAFA